MNTTKTDQVKQFIDQGLKSLIENLESGKSDQLTAYITAMAKFHRYSFRNIMLILSQFPEAIEWPENHRGPVAKVLTLDPDSRGEKYNFPGDWPMTAEAIAVLRDLDGFGE